MAYNWNKMVEITVPVGLNGWLYSGEITINGITTKFHVGIPTSMPEPVAAMIQNMIAVEETEKTQMPNNHYRGNVTIPTGKVLKLEKGAMIEDEAGVLGSGGGTSGPVVVLEETTVELTEGTGAITTPFAIRPEEGKVYNVTYNGTGYDCPAVAVDVGGGTIYILLGNGSQIGVEGSNDDAPFVIGVFPETSPADGVYGDVADMTGASSATISIVDTGKTVTKDTSPLYVHATHVREDGNVTGATVDKPYVAIYAALMTGKHVMMIASDTGELPGIILQCVGATGEAIVFNALWMEGMVISIIVLSDDTVAYAMYKIPY